MGDFSLRVIFFKKWYQEVGRSLSGQALRTRFFFVPQKRAQTIASILNAGIFTIAYHLCEARNFKRV